MRKSLWPTVLLAFLIACGGGGPDEPDLSVFTEQTVAWESCDAQLFEEDKEALAPILERLECATVQTPLDWENPELESVNLGVLRVRAADPAKRKGAIALNPGGPGGDGLFIAAIFGLIFAEPDSERVGLPERASFAEISESYDIIGSSPRGVGESFRLYCGSNRLAPANYSAYDTSEDNLDDILLAAQYEADACQANPLTKYIDTEQTARDMDLIRQLLGDEKLNYLGFSYGSWLGAWYAKLFPGQAGNIVLDGNLIFSGTWQDVFELDANSFNRAFEDVALAYVARNNTFYGLGETQAAVLERFVALPNRVKEAYVFGSVGVFGDLYSSGSIPLVGLKLLSAQGAAEVLASFEDPPGLGELLDAVEAYSYAEDEELNAELASYAFDIAFDAYIFENAAPAPVEITSFGAVYQAIVCNDTAWSGSLEELKAGARVDAETYPLLGVYFAYQPCAHWSQATTSNPAVPSDIPPVMMVQNGYDAPTPAEGAFEAFETLPDARMVYVENEVTHTTFPYGTDCVDETVAAYLLNGALPENAVSNCEALPLPGEDQVYPPGTTLSPQMLGATSGIASRGRPEGPLLTKVKAMIRENAANFYGHSPRRPQ